MWVVVGAGGGAALNQVAVLVDVDAVLGVRGEAFDHAGDLGGLEDVVLAEGDHSPDGGGLGVEETDCVAFGVRWGRGAVQEQGSEGESGQEGECSAPHH